MSKGSKIVPVRIPEEMETAMQAALLARNDGTRGDEWSMSDWIRDCIRERLDKPARSKASKARRSAANRAAKADSCKHSD